MRVPVSIPDITSDDVKAVRRAVESGWVSGTSPIVSEFEKEFADFCGVQYGIATNSGTTALHLTLASMNIGVGDEVILPTFTMVATANPVTYLGATPILVDSEKDTWCIDPEKVREAITPKTKAIIPVHIYGHPCDMSQLQEIAFEHDLLIIEDAAEAHGAEYKRKKVGGFGDASIFSMYANKIITTGEGGMIVTDDEDLWDRAIWLRAHAFGRHGKHYRNEEVGFGYRMNAMSAALGLSQLSRIDYYIEKRRLDAWIYRRKLTSLEESGLITFPVERDGYKSVYWMFSILFNKNFPLSRDTVVQRLSEKGIETRTFFHPLHQLPMYENDEEHPVAEEIARTGINLPSGNATTREEINFVCQSIMELVR